MSHARLKMEADSLEKNSKWKNIDGKEYTRNLIIIDEKLPIIEISTLKLTDLDQFLFDIKSLDVEIEITELEECEGIIDQLRKRLFL